MTEHEPDVAGALVEFAAALPGYRTAKDVLLAVGDYCTELLPVDGVGVLLREESGGLGVATANSEIGRAVEQLEAELGEGPCSVALATGEQISVPDVEAATADYPRFAPRALDAGVRSIFALPMTVRAQIVGSLDVVVAEPRQLDADQLAAAQLLADVAISYVGNARVLGASAQLAAQLQQALDSRVVLEQAKGVIAERHGIPPDAAFERIRARARAQRRKIREVAQEVLRGEADV